MRTILEFINKGHIVSTEKTIAVYKDVTQKTDKPTYEAELYYALVDDEDLLKQLVEQGGIKDDYYIRLAFTDRWSSSDTAPHNVWLRPVLKNRDQHVHNFFNDAKINKDYEYIKDIKIKDFNKIYWIKNFK